MIYGTYFINFFIDDKREFVELRNDIGCRAIGFSSFEEAKKFVDDYCLPYRREFMKRYNQN